MKQSTTQLLKQKQIVEKWSLHLFSKISAAALLFAAITCLTAQTSQAQSFQKGSSVFNLGIGFGTTLYDNAGSFSSFPPISISYEHSIVNDKFGIGGYLAHTGSKFGNKNVYWKYSYTVIGLRGDYHFYTTDKLDTYGGVMIGYDIVSDKYHGPQEGRFDYKASSSTAVFSIFAGGDIFSPKILEHLRNWDGVWPGSMWD